MDNTLRLAHSRRAIIEATPPIAGIVGRLTHLGSAALKLRLGGFFPSPPATIRLLTNTNKQRLSSSEVPTTATKDKEYPR
jgi:hypothetical protein